MTAAGPDSIDTATFDRTLALRDAYRIMERFVQDYLARGDGPVSDFLHVYASSLADGRTTDPAAVQDFLQAAAQVLDARPSGA